jgi:hypothetical protein
MEEWKIITDYPNYSVSSFGNVRNDKTGRILKKNIGTDGYLRVCLNKKCCKIHRLVGLAFIDNPNNYREIDHIYGDKNDNNIINLRWCIRGVNVANTPKYIKGEYSSKYRGIYFHAKNKNWCASVSNENKKKHLGSFNTEKEAVETRNKYITDNNLPHFKNIYLEL